MSYDAGATVHAASVNTSSDLRLKSFIQPVQLGLQFINKLYPVSYFKMSKGEYEDNGSNGSPHVYEFGLIAQDVKKILNDFGADNDLLVTEDIDGYHGMDYTQLVMPLIKSVQELSDEVDRLKKEIEELKK
jgi:hypothetical protein